MIDKITPELVQDAKDLLERVEKTHQLIVDRIDYVAKTIFQEFDEELIEWGFWPHNKEDIYAFGSQYLIDEELRVNITYPEELSQQEMFLLDKDGQAQNLLNGSWLHLPSRWLFEDFEEELKEGRQKYLDQQVSKTENEETIIKTAKAKLTKQELEALTEALLHN